MYVGKNQFQAVLYEDITTLSTSGLLLIIPANIAATYVVILSKLEININTALSISIVILIIFLYKSPTFIPPSIKYTIKLKLSKEKTVTNRYSHFYKLCFLFR